MKKTKQTHRLSVLLLGALLVAAMLFCTTGCDDTDKKETPVPPVSTDVTAAAASSVTEMPDTEGVISLGEGASKFSFSVTDGDGNETLYKISTDQETVGEALLSLGLIEGEAGQYGLYVKRVCGITADYDTTKTYWAFYIDGEYAMSGVDTTKIAPGTAYAFKVEK